MPGAAIKLLLPIPIVLAAGSLAFGQAGSTGGVIGKENKEATGSTPPPASGNRIQSRSPHPAEPERITVTSATLGANCGAPQGNVTSQVAGICNGHDTCELPGSRVNKPDPALGCAKTFAAQWKCSSGKTRSAAVAAVALETNVLTLNCN
jgi:hypothetical protein